MSFAYPLATSSWDQAEYDAIQRVVDSGRFSMGHEVAQCERDFAAYLGSRYSVMVNSGSSANLLMVAALRYTQDVRRRLMPGDEVIVPAVSWSTTYYPLHQYGLVQRFVDVDIGTLNYDLEALAAAVTDKTRAIMVVNLLGNPNDFNRIDEIVGGRDIVIIEDNCESMGSIFAGRMTGTFGVMGSFSAFFSHHISTMEGGFVATDDDEIFQLLLCLRAHGWTRNLANENLITGTKSDDPFVESYRFVLPGYNVRPLEMSGAIGIEQIRKLPGIIAARRDNGRRLQDALSNHPNIMIQQEVGESSWFGFSLVVRPGSDLDRAVLLARLEALGFECRPIVAGNFARSDVMRYMDTSSHGELINADYIDRCGLFIGNHHYPIEDAINILSKI